MSIQPVHVAGDGLIWSCEFYNSLCVSDQGGVVSGTPIINKGVQASGDNTDLIQFRGNDVNLLSGATQATWNLKFRTGANVTNDNVPLARYTAPGNGNFFFDLYNAAGLLDVHLANAVGANRINRYIGILPNTDYDFTIVYNSTGLLFLAYLNGAPVAFVNVSGAFPASLPIYNGPLEVLGYGGAKYARTGFKLYAAYVFNFAMSAAEAADWYARTTNRELVPS